LQGPDPATHTGCPPANDLAQLLTGTFAHFAAMIALLQPALRWLYGSYSVRTARKCGGDYTLRPAPRKFFTQLVSSVYTSESYL